MKRTLLLPIFLMTFVASLAHAAPNADHKSAAEILPGSSLVYAELSDSAAVIKLLMDHPIRKKLEASDGYKQYLASPQYEQLQNGLALFEKQTGMKWRDAIESMSGGGLYVGFDLSTNGFALLMKATDSDKLATIHQAVAEAVEKQNRGAIQKGRTYRDIDTWKIGKGGFAIVGKWFLFTNNPDMGKTMFDNLLDGSPSALANDRDFKAAAGRRGSSSDQPTAWAFARLPLIRGLGLLNKVLPEKSDNPGAELLFGGVQETLKNAPFITTALRVKNEELRLTIGAPHDPSEVSAARSFFFSPQGKGAAPKPLKPPGTMLSFTVHRDLAAMFRSADELFEENIAANIAQSDSQLTLFFSGRPFYSEVLGSFHPQMQIIVTQPTFKDVTPAIKVPAFAMVMRLKNTDDVTVAQFRTAFHTILNFVNLQGTQDGKPMLLTDLDKIDGATLLFSKYVFDASKGDKTKADIIYNFSPSMAIYGDRIMIASTRELAEQLIASAKAQKSDELISQNTLLELDGPAVLQALKDNRETLVSQNMLEKGHTPAQANAEIDTLLDLVSYVRSIHSSMTFQDKWATLDLSAKLTSPK